MYTTDGWGPLLAMVSDLPVLGREQGIVILIVPRWSIPLFTTKP